MNVPPSVNSPFTSARIQSGTVHSQSHNRSCNITNNGGTLNVRVFPVSSPIERTADIMSPSTSTTDSDGAPSTPSDSDTVGQLPSRLPFARYPKLSWITSASIQSEFSCSSTTASGTHNKHRCVLTPMEKTTLIPDDSRIRQYMLSNFFFVKEAIPLWWPSPAVNAAEELQELNISVGDIGAFNNSGGFDVFFNIFLPAEKNKAFYENLPSNFSPFPLSSSSKISKVDKLSRNDYKPRSGDFKAGPGYPNSPEREYIASYFLSTKSTTRVGSILDLPDGAWKEYLSPGMLKTMTWYFDLHAENWYAFCKERELTKGLRFVKCVYKCKTWAIATCSTTSPGEIFARVYRKEPNTDLYGWEQHPEVHPRMGPELFGQKKSAFDNQCVALEVSSIAFSSTPFHRKVKNSISTLKGRLSKVSLNGI